MHCVDSFFGAFEGNEPRSFPPKTLKSKANPPGNPGLQEICKHIFFTPKVCVSVSEAGPVWRARNWYNFFLDGLLRPLWSDYVVIIISLGSDILFTQLVFQSRKTLHIHSFGRVQVGFVGGWWKEKMPKYDDIYDHNLRVKETFLSHICTFPVSRDLQHPIHNTQRRPFPSLVKASSFSPGHSSPMPFYRGEKAPRPK